MTKYVAIDFETHLIGPGAIFPKPVCVSSSYDGFKGDLHIGPAMGLFLKRILDSNDIIIAHNASFECGVIYYHFPELIDLLFKAMEEGRIICTKINEQHINLQREKQNGQRFSLANLVQYYFKTDISASKTADAWRLRYSELDGVPQDQWPQEAVDYAIDDSIWAYKIYQKQDKMDIGLSVKTEARLNIMAAKGIRAHKERVQQLKSEVSEHLKPHYDFLLSKDLCTIHKKTGKVQKKVKKLKEYVVSLGIPLRHTKKGAISVDGESMGVYIGCLPDNEILKAFSAIAVYEKVMSSYINHLEEGDTIYSTYNAVVDTGRTSSSSSKFFPSLNMQQMPRKVPNVTYDIRNCFIPSNPGMKILSIDYGALELCATAHQLKVIYGHSAMLDLINSGDTPKDLHSALAAYIMKVPYDEFILKKKEGIYAERRAKAKPVNLGFPGGIGYDKIRQQMWKDGIMTRFNILHTERTKSALQGLYFNLRGEFPSVRICRTGKDEWSLVDDELVALKRDFFNLYPELETFLKDTHKNYIIPGKSKWIKNEFDEWEEEPMYQYNAGGFKRKFCTYTAFSNALLMQAISAVGAKRAVSEVIRRFHNHPDIRVLAFIHDEILLEILESRKDLAREAAEIMIDQMQSVLYTARITVEMNMSDQWQKADGFWTETMFKNPPKG